MIDAKTPGLKQVDLGYFQVSPNGLVDGRVRSRAPRQLPERLHTQRGGRSLLEAM